MEYERKFRWANYGSNKCKEYLRNDFSYECAYCKLQEREIDIIGSEYFEIDHFKPQSDNNPTFNPHLYKNLNYSCEKCNAEKSDFWSVDLLNPCKTNIYKNKAHIIGGYDPLKLYKYTAITNEGQLYIDTFKLNSRHHIRIRKRRKQQENYIKIKNELIDEILRKFAMKQGFENLNESIEKLDALRVDKDKQVSDLLRNESFELVNKYLTDKGIRNSIVLEEYNMDFKLKYKGKSIYCELILDNNNEDCEIKGKFIDKEKLSVWYEKLSYPNWGILYFYPKLNKLYLFCISDIISRKELDNLKTKKKIMITDEFLL